MADPIRPATIPPDIREAAWQAHIAAPGTDNIDAAVAAALNLSGLLAENAVTEWGVRYGGPDGEVQRYYNADDARQARRDVLALKPSEYSVVVTRQVCATPWTEVPEETEASDG